MSSSRVRRAVAGCVAGLVMTATSVVLGAAAQASAVPRAADPEVRVIRPSAADRAALLRAYVTHRGLRAAAVGSIPPSSVHIAYDQATREYWATAGFLPGRHDSAATLIGFQDAGGSGVVFTRGQRTSWRESATATLFSCGTGVPAAVERAWDVRHSASCSAAPPQAGHRTRSVRAAIPDAVSASTIATVAKSQDGVADDPAPANMNVSGDDCNPYSTLVGSGAASCGVVDPNFPSVKTSGEFWCADFTKWVWEQGGVTTNLGVLNGAASSFYQYGVDLGESMPVNYSGHVVSTPQVGDAVVFYPSGNTPANAPSADHVGIVTGVSGGTVDLVNGDFVDGDTYDVQEANGVTLSSWAGQQGWISGTAEQWIFVSPTNGPDVSSFKSSVGSVGFGGGSVTLSAAGSGATSFAFSSSLSGVSGLGTVSSSDGSASDVVSIPENTSLSSRSVSFTVTASASGQTPASASLTVSQAGDPPPAVSSVSVPSVAVADTSVSLSASASDAGGTITGYEWDFGDGQTASTAKPDVTHVFADPQIADVSVTVTDSHGHTATGTGSVDVAAASSAVSTRPATSGIRQHLFYIAPSTRAVSQEYWSGTAWSSQALVSGSAAGAGSAVTSLTYPDSTGLQAQHAFYVGPGDGLDEDYWTGSAWEENVLQDSSVTAADRPAAGSDLVGVLSVTANVIEPHVFYIDNAGGLAQDYVNQSTGDWETQTLAGSPAAGTHLAASAYATSDGHIQLHVFYVSTSGDLAETYYAPGPGWASKAVTGSLTPAAGTALSSTDSGADGANENVFFTDTAGNLARAAYDGTTWTMTAITASHPAASSAIISANYLTAGQLDLEVYYLNGSGDVEQDYSADAGASWSNQTIGNGTVTAATLLGVGDYPIPDQDQHVFYATAAGTIYQDYGNTSNWTNQPIS
jgi:hypothetical protein